MKDITQIRFEGDDGKPVLLTREQITQPEHGQRAQALMHRVKVGQAKPPRCMCVPGGVEMVVARTYGGYHVKRSPNSGHRHAFPSCPSSSPLSEFARDQYSRQALEHDKEDDPVSVSLSMPLSRIQTGKLDLSQSMLARPELDDRQRMKTMTPLGLMMMLWERAALNVSKPHINTISYNAIANALAEAVHEHQIGAGKQPLEQRLYIPEAMPSRDNYQQKEQIDEHERYQIQSLRDKHQACMAHTPTGQTPILLVIGRLMRLTPSGQRGFASVRLIASNERHTVRDYSGILEQLAKHHRGRPKDILQGDKILMGESVWMIMGVELMRAGTPDEYLRMAYARAMYCTHRAIPVESSHEMHLAQMLDTAQRQYIKPLRYDASEFDRPDFILLDTQPHIDMEVWGMSSPEYLKRKRQKVDRHKQAGKQLWQWDAAADESVPPLPPVKGLTTTSPRELSK